MLVLTRHSESISDLTAEEWAALRTHMGRLTEALDRIFHPDLYNFAFLMNLDTHVHLHVIPRYASPHEWRGEKYEDPHFGSLFGGEQRPASVAALEELTRALSGRL